MNRNDIFVTVLRLISNDEKEMFDRILINESKYNDENIKNQNKSDNYSDEGKNDN